MEGRRLGRYKIGRRLAAGGMAEVFVATVEGAAGFQKPVAVKRVLPHLCEDPEFLEMFREEAKLASRLSHANIAQVFDFDEIDGQYLLAMEWVNGKDLRRVLREAKSAEMPPTPAQAAFVGREVARALHHASGAPGPDGRPLGLVHRDVSPQNILLSFTGEVKLTDFGIAKAATGAIATAAGIIKGKSAYMSPEQARGDRLDARSDVFSLGVVLWEMLTGRRLFTGGSDLEILQAVQRFPAAPPSSIRADVPGDLDDVVLRALAKDRRERYESALELESALTNVILKHARGAADLDIAAWLDVLFGDEIRGSGTADLEKAEPRRRATSAALPTPPRPGRLGETGGTRSLPSETGTSDLPAAPPRRERRRAAVMTSAAIGAAATLAVALMMLGPGGGEGAEDEREHSADEMSGGPATGEGAEDEREHSADEMSGGPGGGDDTGRSAPEAMETEPAAGSTPSAGVDRPDDEEPNPAAVPAAVAPGPREGERVFGGARAPKRAAPASGERRKDLRSESTGARSPLRRRPLEDTDAANGSGAGEPELDDRTSGSDEPSSLAAHAPTGTRVLAPSETPATGAAPRPPSVARVPAGTRLHARLSLGVETDEAATVEARLVRSHVAGGKVVLPRGSKLFGRALARGERVTLRFDRLVLPEGEVLRLNATAYGADGSPGIAAIDVLTAPHGPPGRSRVLTLPPGTELTAVLDEELHIE